MLVSSDGIVQDLAQRIRQSVQTCCAHTVGPVVTYCACLDAVRSGKLEVHDLKLIGQAVIKRSLEQIAAYEAADLDDGHRAALLRRERQVMEFVRALFGLEQ